MCVILLENLNKANALKGNVREIEDNVSELKDNVSYIKIKRVTFIMCVAALEIMQL